MIVSESPMVTFMVIPYGNLKTLWSMAQLSLMTDLIFYLKFSRPLQSQTVITDGDWHRVDQVWDGTNRILHVDDIELASHTYDQG